MKISLIVATFVVSLLLGGLLVVPAGFAQPQEEDQTEKIRSEARQMFMRGKLMNNQNIVEGLSLKNFDLIQEGATAVVGLVKGQHWFVLDTPEYRRYSEDMTMAAQRLHDAAKDGNIEAAALRYFDLTLTCIDCHLYLETVGY
ncbi:MAG: hypothetical protein ACR2NP_07675 [Pirellulaceae bacterium]